MTVAAGTNWIIVFLSFISENIFANVYRFRQKKFLGFFEIKYCEKIRVGIADNCFYTPVRLTFPRLYPSCKKYFLNQIAWKILV